MSTGCPICGKPVEKAFRPFCSKRCADVDLQRWFSGRYVVAGGEDSDENPSSEVINKE
ncbi:DNA gyrase inhibitor YacG [Caulobacter sp. BP25]|uniref:DNA gyrase inhibitor YacG n=1 Tax=Caulobacter sp. BP25 TaxID=2048900 RepID=UPI000C129AE6|nr:DNA gyrase inhibitor YacG [Caulobacter sp. BP25]PHY17631.1 DNA gyrase inhibitor YacG [Caulobacter sp. BP25]